MKKMILTGLGTEQKFSEGHPPATEFYLVFNDGELRVPISEEAAQIVVRAAYGVEDNEEEEPEENEPPEEPRVEELNPGWRRASGNGVSDEDGVDQV